MALSEISYPCVRLVTREVLLVHAAKVNAIMAAVARGAMEPDTVRKDMNLTFPMALDYRLDHKAAALVAAGMCSCQLDLLASWQRCSSPVYEPVWSIKRLSSIPCY
jgi:hypothetical protein